MYKHIVPLMLALLVAPLSGQAATPPQGTDTSALNSGNPEQTYRHRSFRAYLPLDELRRRAKVGNYSSFENPTGIFFNAGERATITLSGSHGQSLKLIVHDFERGGAHDVYPLAEGTNTLTIAHRGLAYLDYRSTTPAEAPVVQVGIEGGHVQGIFTRHDSAATWQRLLAQAKCGVLDLVGERCQLVYNIEGLQRGCPTRGPELLATYDNIIRMEQEDILGWHLDGTQPPNHIMGRVQWGGFMHADGMGAAFHFNTIPGLSNPDHLRKGAWGVAHEFGHVNQTRPGMCWAGTTEVTNNIFSSWVNYQLCPSDMRLEHERVPNADNQPMIGGRFDCYVNNAIARRRLWQFHGGPDDGNVVPPGPRTGDHFVSVCPLWQLQLYIAVARGNTEFYPRIFQDVRRTDESKLTPGQLRLLFFTRACDAAKLNLSEFFAKVGMISPMDRMVQDYASAHMTITPDMVQQALAHAAQYPKPDSSVIYYITADNVHIFARRLPIEAPAPGSFQPTISEGRMVVPAHTWQHAVAFEAYKGDTLLRISLRGLGQADHATTTVICPPGTDAVKAVQWDGTRIPIYTAPAP